MSTKKRKITIYDVAAHAGVAISTVSRVLNESTDVSDQTRERVLEAIEELKFRPDRVAKMLAQKQVRSLAIAIPTFTTPFHNELLKGVRSKLHDRENDLLLFDLGSVDPQKKLLSFLKRGTLDGLLLAGVPVDVGLTPELKAFRAPIVLVGNHHSDFDCFYWDNDSGAKAAVQHLIEQGHRRIGMIRAYTDSYLQTKRIEGYRMALEEAGIPFDPALIKSGTTEKHAGFSEEHGYEAMQQLLAEEPKVSAVFASSDVQAYGAWKAIRDSGQSVPENIALVGYDDIKTSQYIGLSSVDQDMENVGRMATERLLARLEGVAPDVPAANLVVPTLQVRESSRYHHSD
jgi:LacI family transcriptional regulator